LSEIRKSEIADIQTILDNQKRLGKRVQVLLILPLIITAALVWMFYRLNERLSDVELGTKLVTIERYIVSDRNYPWAIAQYEELSKTYVNASILARLGMLYFLFDPNNNMNIAIEKLETAKKLDPNNWEIYRNFTYIYLFANRQKDAIESGQQAIKLNKNDANTYNNLAWIYATSDQPATLNLKQAQDCAETAVKLTEGRQSDFLDTLAEVYFREGDQKRALDSFTRAKAAALGDVEKISAHFKRLFPADTL
jgi:tetratricopeptide (TPR) repeat protein